MLMYFGILRIVIISLRKEVFYMKERIARMPI